MYKEAINHGNDEISQSYIRVGTCTIVLLYVACIWLIADIFYAHTLIVFSYAAFSFAWQFWIKQSPNQHTWRRWLVLITDLSITSYFIYSLTNWGTVFYPIYLWIIVGNGIRFGPGLLAGAAIIAVIEFSFILYYSEYWSSHLPIGLSLLVGLVFLPAFYSKLIYRLHSLNDLLANSLEKTQQAAGAKDDFLSHMSHELRTPMNGILGIAKLLANTPLSGKQREYLNLIQGSASTLLSIINDILDFSTIGSKNIKLAHTPFDMISVINEIQALMKTPAADKGLDFNIDIDTKACRHFLGDAARLSQILLNLSANAIKFTPRGSIHIRYWTEPCDNNQHTVFISIEDTGIGISEENLSQIFKQFERIGSDKSTLPQGTGLGLAISQGLAKAMGGTITVQSQLGKGSAFTLRLSLEVARETGSNTQKQHGNQTYNLHALIAEDNHVNQIVAQGLLRSIGIESEIAQNGKKALEQFKGGNFDLIFMDMQMPEMDGVEATREIRLFEKNTPIIGLTANASVKDHDTCIAAGMNAHVKKPIVIDELIRTLTALQDEGKLPKCNFRVS